jgi:hypothetical protein
MRFKSLSSNRIAGKWADGGQDGLQWAEMG